MNISQLYPSKYIKAEDLPHPIRVTIRGLTIEDLGEGPHKPCLFFIAVEVIPVFISEVGRGIPFSVCHRPASADNRAMVGRYHDGAIPP